ncbi:MAG: nucleotidyltransferase domain-containing protein [Candidatus Hodarchaeaceae archaeon]|nr:nucleotidyltransferase domain-containing protein [Candidatus Hodarchaeaceae archaeon]
MVRPVRVTDAIKVVYEEGRWQLLKRLRRQAQELMTTLAKQGIESAVHGSVARGDVVVGSDVDVFVPDLTPSYAIELALRNADFHPIKREIVMATPWHLPKAHIYIEEDYLVTFPLMRPKHLELEFYYFGGAADLKQVQHEIRVPGVDKRLMLIEPTQDGHIESQVVGREAEVAKRVGVSLDIVRERVRILRRRANIGHTGIFLQRELAPDENFEAVFKQLIEGNPAMKLRFKEK